jgi:predicted nucleotidyltransferase component of viral defense system
LGREVQTTTTTTHGRNLIPLNELIAWRKHAPWSNDWMVEQDYLLSQAVEVIFADPKLSKQLAMRGGTVLHKGHLKPASRYSEDIDLVATSSRSKKGITEDLVKALRPLLGEPSEIIKTWVTLTLRNWRSKSQIARLTYVYDPTDTHLAQGKLKVEVNLNESVSVYPISKVSIDVPKPNRRIQRINVPSYDLDEMLGTKMRALLQREHGRDLYDLWRAWVVSQQPGSSVTVNPARVGAAFRYYLTQEGSTYSANDALKEIERRMKSKKFLQDMNGYLPSGVSYSPHDAAEHFKQVFHPHIDGPVLD